MKKQARGEAWVKAAEGRRAASSKFDAGKKIQEMGEISAAGHAGAFEGLVAEGIAEGIVN
eukprot:487784-Pyramimonas_sp.AAC.1